MILKPRWHKFPKKKPPERTDVLFTTKDGMVVSGSYIKCPLTDYAQKHLVAWTKIPQFSNGYRGKFWNKGAPPTEGRYLFAFKEIGGMMFYETHEYHPEKFSFAADVSQAWAYLPEPFRKNKNGHIRAYRRIGTPKKSSWRYRG